MPNNDQITITSAAFAFALWLALYVRHQWRASRQPAGVERVAEGDYIYRTNPDGAIRGSENPPATAEGEKAK
jgi:hypothetical protein